jgi:Bifunctional DNA primase/polymerase, N-terminal
MSVRTFAELAPWLVELGYEPVPIKPGTKAPTWAGWQDGHPPVRYLRTASSWGVGILCRSTPAIDLDVCDRALVHLLIELADDVIGGAPVRYGQAPKALIPFNAEAPFPKVLSRWFALPGEDYRADGYKAHRCEVLGDGQQFVAYAVHPGTGRPYRWARGDLMQQWRVDLPYLDGATAQRFIDTADKVFLAFGCTALERDGSTWRPWSERREPKHDRQHIDTSALDGLDLGTLARKVDPKAFYGWGSWRARCPVHRGASHTSLVLREDRGKILWHCHAGCSQADVAEALREAAR